MKRLSTYIFGMLLILAFSSCEKDDGIVLADEYNNAPVFTFTANDGLYGIAAGSNHFYMFSDYEIDERNIHSFVARFEKLSTCLNNCEESLVIKVRELDETSSAPTPAVSTVIAGDYSYLEENDEIGFGDVLIEYTNNDGITFQTDLIDQSPDDVFKILSIVDYNINEEGHPTKLLEVSFSCLLRSAENGTTISFNNAQATIAVAHPD